MKKLIVFFIGILLSQSIFSQKNELGFHLGGAYYIGDLNPAIHFNSIRPAGGLTYRRNITDNLALRGTGSYMMLASDNAKSGFNKYGDVSFKSQLIELAAVLEVDFFPFFMGSREYLSTPYIFGGIAGYYQNPTQSFGNDDNSRIFESFSKYGEANKLGLSLPFGAGVKTKLTDKICLAFEWGLRKTFSDHIDMVESLYIFPENSSSPTQASYSNVSNIQVGSEEDKDWYSFAGVHITFKIKNKTKECKIYDSVK